jgi:hypothetical protein
MCNVRHQQLLTDFVDDLLTTFDIFFRAAGNPDVIVATPGRLAHHLAEVAGFGLKAVEYVVFDEADRCEAAADVGGELVSARCA